MALPIAGSRVPPTQPVLNRAHQLAQGLVGCWLFSAPTGGLVRDMAGGNHGILTGATWAVADGSGAAQTTANGQYVICGTDPSLDLTRQVTLETIVTIDNAAGSGAVYIQGVVDKGYANPNSAYCLRIGDGAPSALKPQFIVCAGGENKTTSPTALTVGQRYHIVGSYDGARQRLYVDGVEVAANNVSITMTLSGHALRLGNNYSALDRPLLGRLTLVRIWNRGLTGGDVAQLYASPYAMFQQKLPPMITTAAVAVEAAPQRTLAGVGT